MIVKINAIFCVISLIIKIINNVCLLEPIYGK